MKTTTLAFSSHVLGRISTALILLNVLAAFLYAVLLLGTVMRAASRQSAESHIRSLAIEVEGLEAQYLAKTQSITPDTATQLGFVVPTSVSTVYIDNGLHALSLRNR